MQKEKKSCERLKITFFKWTMKILSLQKLLSNTCTHTKKVNFPESFLWITTGAWKYFAIRKLEVLWIPTIQSYMLLSFPGKNRQQNFYGINFPKSHLFGYCRSWWIHINFTHSFKIVIPNIKKKKKVHMDSSCIIILRLTAVFFTHIFVCYQHNG